MEEGSKLIGILLIGALFLIFAAFFVFIVPSQEETCPPGQTLFEGECIDLSIDIPDIICPPGYTPVDSKCVKILPDAGDDDDDEPDVVCPSGQIMVGDECVDEEDVDDDEEDDGDETSSETKIVCGEDEYYSDGECILCASIVCETDIDCLKCPNTQCIDGKCAKNPLLEILYGYAIPIALLISYSIVALAFMISKLFNSREAEGWAKIELREVLVSTMYAAIILSAFPIFNNVLDEFSKSQTTLEVDEMFEDVLNVSVLPLRRTLQYTFTLSLLQFLAWSPSATTYLDPWPFLSVQPFYEHRIYLNFFNLFANTFLPIIFAAFISIIGQLIFLSFFEKTIFILIAIGIFLRSFTFTRKMGGTLLAIVLGIFFLLKLLMVIQGTIYLNGSFSFPEEELEHFDKLVQLTTLLFEAFIKLMDTAFLPTWLYSFITDCAADMGPVGVVICIIIAPIMWVIELIIGLIMLIGGVVGFIVSYFATLFAGVIFFSDLIDGKIVSLIAIYADVVAFAFFMPILNFIIVIAGIKSLAETMGGDPGVINMLSFI
jgi:hypothetical protein